MAIQGASDIVTDGLVFCVDAANHESYQSGSVDFNDIVNSNNGTLTNNPTFNSDKGGSIVFDGTDDYVDFPTPAATNSGTENSSINVWLRTSSNITSNQTLYSERDGDVHIFSKLRINTNTFDYIFLTPSSTLVLSSNTGGLSTNSWYNVCGTKSGNTFRIYINGTLSNSKTQSMGSFSTSGNIFSRIGRETIGFYLSGRVASQQIYNRDLSATEVLQNYNALKTRFGL